MLKAQGKGGFLYSKRYAYITTSGEWSDWYDGEFYLTFGNNVIDSLNFINKIKEFKLPAKGTLYIEDSKDEGDDLYLYINQYKKLANVVHLYHSEYVKIFPENFTIKINGQKFQFEIFSKGYTP